MHAGRSLEDLYRDRSTRQELYDKLVSILKEDTHPERRAWTSELGLYALEVLTGLGAAVELDPSQLSRATLPFAVATALAPREERLIQAAQRRRLLNERDDPSP